MGYVIKPEDKPIKHFRQPVWYGLSDKGQKIFMNAMEAQAWAKETGRPVFLKCKRYELDEL